MSKQGAVVPAATSVQNGVIELLQKIVNEADRVYITHGRKAYALSDPECPTAKVSSFVKTKLDQLLVKG